MEGTMNNSHMRPNRFFQWQQYKKRFAEIQAHLGKGGSVLIPTCTKATLYRPKHAGMFKVTRSGLFVQRGKSFECLNFSAIRLT
jgi:hypothetical protein